MRDSAIERARPRIEASREASDRPRRPLSPAALISLLLLLFIGVPIAALFWRAIESPSFRTALSSPLVIEAMKLTAITSLLTVLLALTLGTPLAWVLARRRFPGKVVVETLIDLPLVLPPVVAGVALLMAFGRRGVLGDQLQAFGIELPFTTAAVVLAQLFVSIPFYVRGAKIGFQGVPHEIEEAAEIDGASPWASFRHITLPLALPGIASGIVLCWARSISEFGATLMFAGNFSGRTQTMPLAILTAMETDLGAALALSVLLVIASGTVLLLSRILAIGRLDN